MPTKGLSSNVIMVKTLAFRGRVSIELSVVGWRDLFLEVFLFDHSEALQGDPTQMD